MVALYTFRDVEFGEMQTVSVALRKITGIGLSRANYLCATVGLAKTCRVSFMNYYIFSMENLNDFLCCSVFFRIK